MKIGWRNGEIINENENIGVMAYQWLNGGVKINQWPMKAMAYQYGEINAEREINIHPSAAGGGEYLSRRQRRRHRNENWRKQPSKYRPSASAGGAAASCRRRKAYPAKKTAVTENTGSGVSGGSGGGINISVKA
jgi:hypothetical protein